MVVVALIARLALAQCVRGLIGVWARCHGQTPTVLAIARRAHALGVMLPLSVRAFRDFLSVFPHTHLGLLRDTDGRLSLENRLRSSGNLQNWEVLFFLVIR